jgi:FkbM family methyltransferase
MALPFNKNFKADNIDKALLIQKSKPKSGRMACHRLLPGALEDLLFLPQVYCISLCTDGFYMGVSKYKNIFRRWPLKQALQLYTGALLQRVNIKVYQNLLWEDYKYRHLSGLGFLMRHDGPYIVVEKSDCGFKQVWLRRQSSDVDVFLQIFVDDEFSGLFSVISNKKEIKTIIDAGANVGLSSIRFSSIFPNMSVIAIEPDEENFSLLNKNLKANQVSHSSVRSGVWNKNTRLYFDRTFGDGKEWAIAVTETPNEGPSIQSVSIDDLMEQHSIGTVDLLKIDVEGSEKQIFLGDGASLDFLQKTKYIAIEIHEQCVNRNSIEQLLIDRGFELAQSGEYVIGKNKLL